MRSNRIMVRFSRLLGFTDPSPGATRIALVVMSIGSTWSIAFQLSTTFWMISIATVLGGGDFLVGMAMVGLLVILRIVVQVALDYPTGGIGDWIGQRWIIASALICFSIAFFLTAYAVSFIFVPFSVFILIYVLMGLGASQESGALAAWFDNNYRVVMPQDKDRKEYGVFWSRVGMVFQLISTLVLIPGSILAFIFGAGWVFQVQGVIFIFLAVIAFLLIRDLPGARKEEAGAGFRKYARLLKDGIRFMGSSKFVALTMAGEMLIWAVGITWWEILLWPLYYSYLLSAIAVSVFRTSMFLPMVIGQERAGVISKRFDPVKWIPRFRFIQFIGFTFFVGLIGITILFPPPPEGVLFITLLLPFTNIPFMSLPFVSILPVMLIWVLFVGLDFLARTTNVLNGRVMLDVFPNRIRNCMYSLRPTISFLLSIPIILVISQLLPVVGFPAVFAIAAAVSFSGAFLIRKGFQHPIPRDESIEEQISKAADDEPEVFGEDDVVAPDLVPVAVPAQRQSTIKEVPD